jgi:hypothetical protein
MYRWHLVQRDLIHVRQNETALSKKIDSRELSHVYHITVSLFRYRTDGLITRRARDIEKRHKLTIIMNITKKIVSAVK